MKLVPRPSRTPEDAPRSGLFLEVKPPGSWTRKTVSESNWPNCSCDRLVKNQSIPGLHPTHTGVRFGQV